MSHISQEWDQSHPRLFLTPFSPSCLALPVPSLVVWSLRADGQGFSSPHSSQVSSPEVTAHPWVAPRQHPSEGSLVWGKAAKAWEEPPEMGSVLPADVASWLSWPAATCWSHQAHARGGHEGQPCCPCTWTQDRFQISHQNSRNNKVLNPSGFACSQGRGECLIAEHVKTLQERFPWFFRDRMREYLGGNFFI